jgi:hypothetical protein
MPYAACVQFQSSTSTIAGYGTIAGYARKIAQNAHPSLEIAIHDHSVGKVYTTFDAVAGIVSIRAPRKMRFDQVRITLEGTTTTSVEDMPASSFSTKRVAHHHFLKLAMPMTDADCSLPLVAEAGRAYTFPFNVSLTSFRARHAPSLSFTPASFPRICI